MVGYLGCMIGIIQLIVAVAVIAGICAVLLAGARATEQAFKRKDSETKWFVLDAAILFGACFAAAIVLLRSGLM